VNVGTIATILVLVLAAAGLAVWRERAREGARTFTEFLRDVTGEVKKITWPDREQLRQLTLVILGFVALVAVVIGTMDIVLQWVIVTLPSRLV
jgi:preprotein translocase subunit SecE